MAICVSTVFGCLITVNAADTGATYTITADAVYAYADEGKATITFDLESGFTGGSFTMLKNNSSYGTTYDKEGNLIKPAPWNYEFSDVEIKVVGGIDTSGNSVSADDMTVSIFNDTDRDGQNDAQETDANGEQYLSDKENVVARFEVNDQTIEVKATDMINNNSNPDKRAGRYHLVRLKGINVANLCDDIKVTLLYNGVEVGTGSISVAGFGFTAGDAGEEFAYYKTASQALVFYAEALQNKIAVTSWSQNEQ